MDRIPAHTQEILTGFTTTHVEKAPVSSLYKSGMLLVLLGMIFLPIAYLGLIGLALYLTWLWVSLAPVLFSGGGGGISKVILYCVPLVAGLALVFFMFKPLFSRRKNEYRQYMLDQAEEPGLREFVRKICEAVGAPLPVNIALNCDVNTSASFEGGLSDVLTKKLSLTIGLPLIEGMSARSLAGVIAHEMGHFAQGSGIRVSYLIRQINNWFGRVVYERDKWDLALEGWKKSDGHWGIRLAGYLSEVAVKVGRYALLGLMKAGHAISCFMLRQMEYDADTFEAKVAGSAHFASTFGQLNRLGLAAMKARSSLEGSWEDRRLPHNIAAYIAYHSTRFSAEEEQYLNQQERQEEPHWYDTHPTTAQRIEYVETLNEPGIFHCEERASNLLVDYQQLAKSVTHHHYTQELGLPLDQVSLVDHDELSKEEEVARHAIDQCAEYFERRLFLTTPLGVPSPLESNDDALLLLSRLKEARERVKTERDLSANTYEDDCKNDAELIELHRSVTMLKVGFEVEPKTVDGGKLTLSDAEEQLNAAKQRASELARKQEAFLQSAQQCFDLAVWLSMKGSRAEPLRECANTLMRCREVGLMHYGELRVLLVSTEVLLAPVQDPRYGPAVLPLLDELTNKMEDRLKRIKDVFGGSMFPFEHWKGRISMQEYFQIELSKDAHRIFQTYEEAQGIMRRYYVLYFRLLAAFIEEVEAFESIRNE